MIISNMHFNTIPLLAHVHGYYPKQNLWKSLLVDFFNTQPKTCGNSSDVTVITYNANNNPLNFFEQSVRHLGVSSFSKCFQKSLCSKLDQINKISTPYVLYADALSSILLDNPSLFVFKFMNLFLNTQLIFSSNATESSKNDFNTGAWFGKTSFLSSFFTYLVDQEANFKNRQDLFQSAFYHFYPFVTVDTHCELFQPIAYENNSIIKLNFDLNSEKLLAAS